MQDNFENLTKETVPIATKRNTPFCVIAKDANEQGWHDLQSSSAWSANPYGYGYAVVPDNMVESIMETCGYCDLELNEDGTEVVGFTAREIPDIPSDPEEPMENEVTTDDLANAILEGVNEV